MLEIIYYILGTSIYQLPFNLFVIFKEASVLDMALIILGGEDWI